MKGFHKRRKREKAFRRGSQIEEKKPKHNRGKDLKGFYRDSSGVVRPITRRKELTPFDVARSVSKGIGSLRLGSFGINLARGLDTGSKQLGPHISRMMASARQQASAGPMPTGPPVPIGQGLDQFDQQVLQQRQIGTPQIVDKQDVISGRKEDELARYVKEAMRAMPIGTDTSVEPEVTVVPRTQFHAMTGHPSPARTLGRNRIEVSDELFDLSPKQRRGIVGHEVWHALKQFDVWGRDVHRGRGLPQEWAERDAAQFENTFEPQGAQQNAQHFSRPVTGGMPSMFGR